MEQIQFQKVKKLSHPCKELRTFSLGIHSFQNVGCRRVDRYVQPQKEFNVLQKQILGLRESSNLKESILLTTGERTGETQNGKELPESNEDENGKVLSEEELFREIEPLGFPESFQPFLEDRDSLDKET